MFQWEKYSKVIKLFFLIKISIVLFSYSHFTFVELDKLEINFPSHPPNQSRLPSLDPSLLLYSPQPTFKSQPILAQKIKINLDDISANIFLEAAKNKKNLKSYQTEIHQEAYAKTGLFEEREEKALKGGIERAGEVESEIERIRPKKEPGEAEAEAIDFETKKNDKSVKIEKNEKKEERNVFFRFQKVECEIIKPDDDKIGKEAGWEFKDNKILRLKGCKFYENQVREKKRGI